MTRKEKIQESNELDSKGISITELLQKNYAWVVALVTGMSVVVSIIFSFIIYIRSIYFFNYFGLSYSLFDVKELGFLYNFGISILFLLCFGSLIYCYIQFINFKVKKLNIKTILLNLFLILISNLIILYFTCRKLAFIYVLVNLILLILSELFSAYIFNKIVNNNKNEDNNTYDISNALKILPFYLIFVVFLFMFSYGVQTVSNKSYRIINNEKVIVYGTNDYYVILDCEIDDNKLTIHKGEQTKISNENVKSELMTFDEIVLK